MTARNRRQIDRDCAAVLFGFIKIRTKGVISSFSRGRIFRGGFAEKKNTSRIYMRNYICLYDFHTLLVQIHGHMGGQVYHGPMGRARARPMVNLPTQVAMYLHKQGMEII